MNIQDTLAIIERGTDEILPLDELKKKLEKNKPLRIKSVSYTHLTLPTILRV